MTCLMFKAMFNEDMTNCKSLGQPKENKSTLKQIDITFDNTLKQSQLFGATTV